MQEESNLWLVQTSTSTWPTASRTLISIVLLHLIWLGTQLQEVVKFGTIQQVHPEKDRKT